MQVILIDKIVTDETNCSDEYFNKCDFQYMLYTVDDTKILFSQIVVKRGLKTLQNHLDNTSLTNDSTDIGKVLK